MSVKFFRRAHNLVWVAYFALFMVSPLDYKVQWDTLGLVIALLLLGNFAFVFGYNLTTAASQDGKMGSFHRDIASETLFKFIGITSLTYFGLVAFKYISLFSAMELDFSFAAFSKLRMILDTPDFVKGSTGTGVIASIFSGFPLLAMPFLFRYRNRLNKLQRALLLVIFIVYLASTFATGGRNGALFTVLIFLVAIKVTSFVLPVTIKFLTGRVRVAIGVAGIVLLGVFAKIFIDRAVLTSGSVEEYVTYFSETHHSNLKPYARNWLSDPDVVGYYFPAMLFHEYIVHSLKEFEIIIQNQPASSPYFGAYNFYPFCLFFNKVGFDFLTIDQIQREIPNPGRYTTLFGGLYLDFGKSGLFCFVAILYFLTGFMLRSFLVSGSFVSLAWFLYLYVAIVLSPIYSVLGMAIYPGLLVAIIAVQSLFFLSGTVRRRNPVAVPGYL